MGLGLVTFYLDWNKIYRGDFMLMAFYLFVACCVIMTVTTVAFPEALKAEARPLVWEDWREPLRGEAVAAVWPTIDCSRFCCWWFSSSFTSFFADQKTNYNP